MPRSEVTTIGADGVHEAHLTGASDALWTRVGPELREGDRPQLDQIINTFADARAQAKEESASVAKDNAALRLVLEKIEALSPDDARSREKVDLLITALGGDAGWRVHQALGKAARLSGRDYVMNPEQFSVPILRRALVGAVVDKSGPRIDGDLRQAVFDLLVLYGRAGRKVTHSNRTDALYEQEPQSAAGRFVWSVIRDVDPAAQPSKVSSAIARVLPHVRKALSRTL